MARAKEQDEHHADDDSLLRSLCRHWAQGTITSPKMVQEFAYGALKQGASGLERAAALGYFGERPQMLQRGSVSLFGSPRGACDFTWIPVPMVKGNVFVPVLMPPAFVGALFEQRHEVWKEAIRGPERAAKTFWDHLAGTDMVRKHPHLPEAHRARTIPLGLHGDGGQFSKTGFIICSVLE